MWASKFELQVITGRVFCLTMTEYDAKNYSRTATTASSVALACTLAYCEQTPWQGLRHFDGSTAPKCSSHPCCSLMVVGLPRVLLLSQLVGMPCAPGRLLVGCSF